MVKKYFGFKRQPEKFNAARAKTDYGLVATNCFLVVVFESCWLLRVEVDKVKKELNREQLLVLTALRHFLSSLKSVVQPNSSFAFA